MREGDRIGPYSLNRTSVIWFPITNEAPNGRLGEDGPAAEAQPHKRFLWREFFERLRRLCLFIFKRRFFLRLPMGESPLDVSA